MKIEPKWETVINFELRRMPVFGGWLVNDYKYEPRLMVFVPDTNHEWEIK